jgi:hypothetical protein
VLDGLDLADGGPARLCGSRRCMGSFHGQESGTSVGIRMDTVCILSSQSSTKAVPYASRNIVHAPKITNVL